MLENSKFICDEIPRSSRGMTQGLGILEFLGNFRIYLKNSRILDFSLGILEFILGILDFALGILEFLYIF